jgi:hypothetical protein
MMCVTPHRDLTGGEREWNGEEGEEGQHFGPEHIHISTILVQPSIFTLSYSNSNCPTVTPTIAINIGGR